MHRPDHEPDRFRFPVRGIDVSHHQGVIDWATVAANDVAFAYLKASEGGDHRDRAFARNIAEANRIRLPVGAYHFFSFRTPGADQARNFVDAVRAGATQLPPVIDLEVDGDGGRRPSRQRLRREVEAFLDHTEGRLGRVLVYYATDAFLAAYGDALPKRSLWRRSMLREPTGPDWVIWQYDSDGRIPGIAGEVDLNVLSISLEELTVLGRVADRSGL